MSKYLKLFAKAIGIPQPIERSRYELETNQSRLAENGRREVDSTLEEPPTEEEAPTPEPQKDRELAFTFRLECTCGSWGHECTEEKHDCPTECLIHIPVVPLWADGEDDLDRHG